MPTARLGGVASLPYVAELHHLQQHAQLCADSIE